jgi:hypothetical protein|tara:strand:+ start:3148 stop:3513 length:366 start_codon:yes stop_codon:yes gene_type:complete
MSSEEKTKFFSLTLKYMLEQLQQTDDQLIFGQALLQHFFNSEGTDYSGIIEIVVDIMWLNYSVLKILTPLVEDTDPQLNESSGESEYMIDETSMLTLQTIAISRYQMNRELNQRSYSILAH